MKTTNLGALQEKIMEILWAAKKPLKPAEVQAMLGNKDAYTTIMTILKRMADKKIVKRKMVGKVYYYQPSSCKEKFVESNLKNIYGDLMSAYGPAAIANFVDVVKSNKKDMELLKEYLENNR
jgi:predicted transcriptional regulator